MIGGGLKISLSIVYPALFILSTGLMLLISEVADKHEASKVRALQIGFVLLTGIAYGVVGYLTISDPMYSADWDRLVWEMSTAKDAGFISLLTGPYAAHPLSAVLVYLVGVCGNPALLRFISSFVFVVVLQLLVLRVIDLGCRPAYATCMWMIVMSCLDYGNMLLVNVRFEIAAMLFLYAAIWIGTTRGSRHGAWAILVVAALLHSSMLLLLIAGLIASIKRREWRVVGLVALLSSGLLLRAAEPILSWIPVLGEKVSLYVANGWSGINMQLSDKTVLFNALLLIAGVLIPLLLSSESLWKSERGRLDFLPRYSLAVACLAIGLAFLTDNFTRFAQLIPIVVSPVLAMWLSNCDGVQNGSRPVAIFGRRVQMAKVVKAGIAIYVVVCIVMRSALTLRFYEVVL